MNINALDTNVLLETTFESIIEGLVEPTKIVIPLATLEELDTFKKGFEPKNDYARSANRFLDALRQKGQLHNGVEYKGHIISVPVNVEELDLSKPDYKIINQAKELDATLITQDINMRVIADAVGVKTSDYKGVDIDVNKLFTGYREMDALDDEDVSELLQCDYLEGEGIEASHYDLVNNEIVKLVDDFGNEAVGQYKKDDEIIIPLKPEYKAYGITPAVKDGVEIEEQKYLMHLLLDPDIHFVTALGPSGTGKTFITLATALEQAMRDKVYNKIIVMRPLISIGNDIGFLPGDKLEKLENWMGSTFDSLEQLLADDLSYSKGEDEWYEGSRGKIYSLIETGKLELEAMTYVRGRSIPKAFIIVDDAQNMTIKEAATIITRAGIGTKVVFLGDLNEKQIDNHRLTPSSNGLAYVINQFKGEDIVGHITLSEVTRSPLAQLGVEKL